tara:strand:+ start:9390 stop:9629 length:240 start_codon:yes stop_codon:yes gene_type:complete
MGCLHVENEGEMELALTQAVKLAKLQDTSMCIEFNCRQMMAIFTTNLFDSFLKEQVSPSSGFNLQLIVPTTEEDGISEV